MMIITIIGYTVLTILLVCIAIICIVRYYLKKEDPQYILKYVEEHKKEKVCSLMVRRNGELLVTVNENEKLPLASMAKIVIAVEFAKQVAEGKIDRAELIPLRDLEKYYVPNTDGGAHPKWIEDIKERSVIKNETVSIEEVAKGMIQFSSNANTTYLLDKLGAERVNESIKELHLSSHDDFYPYTASLYMRGYVEKELHVPTDQSLDMLRNMSSDEYKNHVFQIHEWMKDEKEWKNRNIPLRVDMGFQRIWSDRLVSATATDYMNLIGKMNSRTVFPKAMQAEVERIFKGTVLERNQYEHAGRKGGSTVFVFTNSFYGTDQEGNKTEIVFMSNDLDPIEARKIRNNLDLFIKSIVTNEAFRKKL
ncbi:serine hydrolase [Bacillus cytotoxicus]|nr:MULTISPECIES: serine hydrolase [Bacillus cereus group]KMT50851.1 D-alanyl-D-alanine carboxypeptidase [Bacillus cytotoxicus]QTR72918.1 serine hydrolase [Bacillus cytotoxicus]QTR80950.1 serine hydrolase [Bacillus cytotoxicus]HDR4572199.1 serine hydrolase [Bacillus cytotoxicus]HDR4588030.1 serine hydrolase [Bacillus cytotoxicus]